MTTRSAEPATATSVPLGIRTGKIADFVRGHGPFVMWLLPCLFAEVLGALVGGLLGTKLVHGYLLGREDVLHAPLWFWGIGEFLYWAVIGAFLFPVMRAHRDRKREGRGNVHLLRRARSRIYNYPSFLIFVTYANWMLGTLGFYLLLPAQAGVGVLVALAFLTTMLNAILVYYAADFLNRNYIVPDYFPDGQFSVGFKFRRPGMMLRFLDLFFVNAFSPVMAILLVMFITLRYGRHDPEELTRLLFTSGAVGVVYWGFALFMTHLAALTFSGPLDSLEAAADAISEERFDVRVAVQSDDQLGRLQTAVNHMGEELARMRTIKTLFGHYVSPEVRDLILEGRVRTEGGERIEAVVLFSDIRSFTAMSERHSPEELVDMLNIHFSGVVRAVTMHNGFVDKFIGDAVMAVFDADFCAGRHCEQAVGAAVDILQGMVQTNARVGTLGFAPLRIGIGMACGPVIRGNVGSEDRRELTVMGDTVNIASRLESATKTVGHPLIVTRNGFFDVCGGIGAVNVVQLEPLHLRGKSHAVEVMALTPGLTARPSAVPSTS